MKFNQRVAYKRALTIVLSDWEDALQTDNIADGQACERLSSRLWHKLRWFNPTYTAMDIQMVNRHYSEFRAQIFEMERRQRFLELQWLLEE